ncbi:MAG: hypothetical protein M3Y60_12120, partial [Bacteroidota bacterium]|nr:hypothetical protein [Bacteroidota bacterium]
GLHCESLAMKWEEDVGGVNEVGEGCFAFRYSSPRPSPWPSPEGEGDRLTKMSGTTLQEFGYEVGGGCGCG